MADQAERKSYFPDIPNIEYEGPDSLNPFAFKHYNAEELVLGKPMKDHLRFAVCWWHSFCFEGTDPFGSGAFKRPWQAKAVDALSPYLDRIDVAFEFFTKLGVEYYTFHDRDVCPEGASIAETNVMFGQVCDKLWAAQQATGVKLLWCTQNLFSHPRYKHGAGTSPDLRVFAAACAAVKRGMEAAHRLGAANYVFWGGREGYMTLLNTDMVQEMDNMAALMRMVVDYKRELGATFQLLVEPKPREPMAHQYDFDAASTMEFLARYGLDAHFRLNIEPNHTTLAGHAYHHDLQLASARGMLGSVDANRGDYSCGWDTDQFPCNPQDCVLLMKVVLEQGGLAPGGLNFDARVRRESSDIADLFIAHIGAMDALARGLRGAARMVEDGVMASMVADRYRSFQQHPLGERVRTGAASLAEVAAWAAKQEEENGAVVSGSGQQELYEMVLTRYLL